jgi:hypothetical protein
MNESWMEMVGDVSLPVFLTGVGAGLFVLVVRAIVERGWPEASSATTSHEVSGLRRWFCEYVGNATMAELELEARGEERRRNWQVRKVVEVVQHEFAMREMPALETEQILEHVREAIRRGGEEPSG